MLTVSHSLVFVTLGTTVYCSEQLGEIKGDFVNENPKLEMVL